METILNLILVASGILGVATVVVLLAGKWRTDTAAAYKSKLEAEMEYDKAIIGAAKVFTVGSLAYVTRGVSGDQIIYEKVAIDANGEPVTANTIDGEALTNHKIASLLVNESIRFNGGSATQLLTADQWEGMGNDRNHHGRALEYLRGLKLINIKQGGRNQGTYTQQGTLQDLMRDLAVNALPLAKRNGQQKA